MASGSRLAWLEETYPDLRHEDPIPGLERVVHGRVAIEAVTEPEYVAELVGNEQPDLVDGDGRTVVAGTHRDVHGSAGPHATARPALPVKNIPPPIMPQNGS